jgi:3-deoxy-manno-octulosonate cytidylyltransferase (CMP-KDO synthetase)
MTETISTTTAETKAADSKTAEFKIVILAIYNENDFPKRVLMDIHGKPMIQYVYECAKRSKADEIVIATNSPRVGMVAEDFGATVCMIIDDGLKGIVLLSEVVDKMGWGDDTIVVNFPADAPFTPRSILQQVVKNLVANEAADYAILYSYMSREIAESGVSVNLVVDKNDYVMYFSYYPIPYQADESKKHVQHKCCIGISASRVSLLRTCKWMFEADADSIEKIDELTLLYNGIKIHAAEADSLIGQRVLSEGDIEKVKLQIAPSR